MDSVKQLAEQAAKGNEKAFGELYELTKSVVWFTCINLLKNETSAKDVMQDTYLTAYSKLSTLNDYGAFQSWVNKIAANKSRDILKSKAVTAVDCVETEELETLEDENFLPDDYVVDREKRRIIMDIVRSCLSDIQYQTVIMYYFDEMTAAEIAVVMDCAESTVLYRLGAARKKIKEGVMQYEEQNDDKLHAIVPIPFLTQLLRAESRSVTVPDVPLDIASATEKVSELSGNAADGIAESAITGGKTMFKTLTSKVIAGTAVAAVAVGIAIAVIAANGKSDDNAVKDKSSENPVVSSTSILSADDGSLTTPVISETEKPALSEDSSEEEPETVEEVDYVPTQEIKDASFESGLVQYNNDVFRNGGYITIKDFVAQYSDRYDFMFGDMSYEEGKEYWLPYEGDKSLKEIHGSDIQMIPKYGSKKNIISVTVVNMTDESSAAQMQDGIVLKTSIAFQTDENGNYLEINTPEWLPKGCSAGPGEKDAIKWSMMKGADAENAAANVQSAIEMLEAAGFVDGDTVELGTEKVYYFDDFEDGKFLTFAVSGDENLFGAVPSFEYTISFDSDGNYVHMYYNILFDVM